MRSPVGISAPAIYGLSQGVYKESKYLGNLLGRVQKIEDPSNNAIENNTFIDLSLAPDALSPSETADTEQAANNEFNA